MLITKISRAGTIIRVDIESVETNRGLSNLYLSPANKIPFASSSRLLSVAHRKFTDQSNVPSIFLELEGSRSLDSCRIACSLALNPLNALPATLNGSKTFTRQLELAIIYARLLVLAECGCLLTRST